MVLFLHLTQCADLFFFLLSHFCQIFIIFVGAKKFCSPWAENRHKSNFFTYLL